MFKNIAAIVIALMLTTTNANAEDQRLASTLNWAIYQSDSGLSCYLAQHYDGGGSIFIHKMADDRTIVELNNPFWDLPIGDLPLTLHTANDSIGYDMVGQVRSPTQIVLVDGAQLRWTLRRSGGILLTWDNTLHATLSLADIYHGIDTLHNVC